MAQRTESAASDLPAILQRVSARRRSADKLPVVALTSTVPLPQLPLPRAPVSGARGVRAGGSPPENARRGPLPAQSRTLWLDGNVLMCACPRCHAPLTVRLWLALADCWRCETSVELTVEQQEEARQLLARHAAAPPPHHAVSAGQGAPIGRAAAPPRVDPAHAVPPDAPQPTIVHEPLAPPRAAAEQRPRSATSLLRPQPPLAARYVDAFFQNMPAWLISLLFHLLLLIILGMLTRPAEDGPYITISTRIDPVVREGGDLRIVQPRDASVYDLGVPDGVDLDDPAQQRAMVRADQDARELRLVDLHDPQLPAIDDLRQQVTRPPATPYRIVARDPRLRVDLVRREGGTTLTEAAVARGLKWLAQHQNPDGSWSLDRFHQVQGCNCNDRGSLSSDPAATSLALLPFLGAGQTHLVGVHRDVVARGLRWLLEVQDSNGDLRGDNGQYPGMYAQGQAAIVLCEAFLMTGDELLRGPAQRAIDFIVAAQYPDGGWRYHPKDQTRNWQGDTSVIGWQLMALQSALAAGLSVPDVTLENASHFLDTVSHDDGALYSYLPGENPTAPMTAEALLCRIYLGWKRNHPPLVAAIDRLLTDEPPSVDRPNIYYWYYATQTMHHFGGQEWHAWNVRMRDVLVDMQEIRGHAAGSWACRGPLTSPGGRIYMTSLAICCLEVYYRHLPIFRQIDLQ